VGCFWACEQTDLLCDEPELPWLVPADYEPGPLSFGRTMIVPENAADTEKVRQKLASALTEFVAWCDHLPDEHLATPPPNHADDDFDI
jgi:hypothetical protein